MILCRGNVNVLFAFHSCGILIIRIGGYQHNNTCQMGKGEPVAMESLAKIATALNCGLDDIVEIQKDGK